MLQAARRFGNQCIVVAIDAKRDPGPEPRWRVYTHGGRNPTELDAVSWARQVVSLGAGEILLTSMDRDGTQAGYDLELTRRVADAVEVPVIASGGAGRAGAFCRRPRPRPRQRRARGQPLSFRHVHHRAGQGLPRRPRHPGADVAGPQILGLRLPWSHCGRRRGTPAAPYPLVLGGFQ